MIEVEEYKVYSDQEGEEELFEHFRFKAEPGLVIIRIDKYLMDRMPNTTRNRLQNAAKMPLTCL